MNDDPFARIARAAFARIARAEQEAERRVQFYGIALSIALGALVVGLILCLYF